MEAYQGLYCIIVMTILHGSGGESELTTTFYEAAVLITLPNCRPCEPIPVFFLSACGNVHM